MTVCTVHHILVIFFCLFIGVSGPSQSSPSAHFLFNSESYFHFPQVTDADWPELTMASSSLISAAAFSCRGGEDCCSAARLVKISLYLILKKREQICPQFSDELNILNIGQVGKACAGWVRATAARTGSVRDPWSPF